MDEAAFENEVRRIARLLWPAAEHDGAQIEDGRERDGIFETAEFVHVVECTISRGKDKAREDFNKLDKLTRKLAVRKADKFIKGWFITLREPTADQRSFFRTTQNRIVATSFDQFRAKLIDGRSYLDARQRAPFGSVRDPETGRTQVSFDYVPLDLVDSNRVNYSISELTSHILGEGRRFVLLGDYGAGKSTTLREIYTHLASAFRDGKASLFPVLLNLRDHHGQLDPVECLERHARSIGFAEPPSLVRAWRAGFIALLLDGFDEFATAGWAGRTKRLRDLRYRSMELLRSFQKETPAGIGLVIAGRAHFFDNAREMQAALALTADVCLLDISEFNEEQIALFLSGRGWNRSLPDWIPSRPLLLSYLASRNLLKDTLDVEAASSPPVGWNILLDKISAREAEIEAGIDPGTVRRLIEHMATLARDSVDGWGHCRPTRYRPRSPTFVAIHLTIAVPFSSSVSQGSEVTALKRELAYSSIRTSLKLQERA